MAAVSLTFKFVPNAVTVKPIWVKDSFVVLINTLEKHVPRAIDSLMDKELKDLKEESTPISQSISKVEVSVKAVIRGQQEDTTTPLEWTLPIEHSISQKQDRDLFLLSLKTGEEFTANVVKRMRAKRQVYLESNPHKKETKEYQLLFKYFIEGDVASGLKLLGANYPELREEDKVRLKDMARQDGKLIYDMLERSGAAGSPRECREFIKEVIAVFAQQTKSTKDRVKNLEFLFKKTICLLAESFKTNIEIPDLKTNNPVNLELKEMRFIVSLDDGSQ